MQLVLEAITASYVKRLASVNILAKLDLADILKFFRARIDCVTDCVDSNIIDIYRELTIKLSFQEHQGEGGSKLVVSRTFHPLSVR